MQRFQSFKYELRPTGEQERKMLQFAGASRFVFNKGLALQKERYERGEKKLNCFSLFNELTKWRHDPSLAWLAEMPVGTSREALRDLDRAYTNFFAKRAKFPKFKKKGQNDSFRYPAPEQIKLDQANSRISLSKLGWLRYRNSREVVGEIRFATVSRHRGKWFVSITTRLDVIDPVPTGEPVGIDMGIVRFATLSDGTFYEPLNSFKKHEDSLRKAQQSMSRKKRGSNNWKKAKAKVQRIHARIADSRNDYLHKASHAISKSHAVVCIEDLKVSNMSKSAKGTVEKPGKNISQKSGLNKAILDQGWGEFRRQLEYKLTWVGGTLVAVPPQNTSRTCPACNHVSKDNRKTQAQFECVECGFKENADLVGAINILRAGYAQLACEVSPNKGQQQEPAEASNGSRLGAVGVPT